MDINMTQRSGVYISQLKGDARYKSFKPNPLPVEIY